jgi:hypothetical protein
MLKLKRNRFDQRMDPESMQIKLAALGCRVLLPFDSFSIKSREMQMTLVESHMRCVSYIPPTHEYMLSEYLSEPILSLAAARLLNGHPDKFINLAPEYITNAYESNILARDKRAILVAQLFLTIAHDLAILNLRLCVSFHSPLPLLAFLQGLFSAEAWEIVHKTRPFHARTNDPDLKTAFANAWVSFTHFVKLGDVESLNFKTILAIIKRGAGIQTSDDEESLDLLIPVFFGDIEHTELAEDCMSFIQVIVKNRRSARQVHVDNPLLEKVPKGNYALTIVMELGVKESGGTNEANERVAIQSTLREEDDPVTDTCCEDMPSNVERRHYVITGYGCTSKTYRCVPENSEVYRTLLASQKPFEGLKSASHEALYEMKAEIFNSDVLSNLSWEQ